MTPRPYVGDEKSERINIFLPPNVLSQLKEEAVLKGLNVSALIRMIVLEHLNKK